LVIFPKGAILQVLKSATFTLLKNLELVKMGQKQLKDNLVYLISNE
jgi:hypothetical protein